MASAMSFFAFALLRLADNNDGFRLRTVSLCWAVTTRLRNLTAPQGNVGLIVCGSLNINFKFSWLVRLPYSTHDFMMLIQVWEDGCKCLDRSTTEDSKQAEGLKKGESDALMLECIVCLFLSGQ
jgi:hypothetical protein